MNITGKVLRDAIISGANNIANNKSAVDELNVFPVPDGDTGTNMSMTIGASLAELMKLPDDVTVEKVASVAASALLRGARGNSGVILSLIFRGFQRGLQGKTEASSSDLSESLGKGVSAAYKAVMKPTEGTMLTVARVASERAAEQQTALEPVMLWDLIVDVSKETLAETPELLPVLKKAGVVDSGGQGLVVIFEGMQTVFNGGKIIEISGQAASMAALGKGVFSEDIDPELSNSYCTEFLVMKTSSANDVKLCAFLESVGDSVVVVDDDELIKCHVHTKDPGKVLSEALKHGYLSKLKIENMMEQYVALQAEGRAAKHASEPVETKEGASEFAYALADDSTPYGFVSISSGDGLQAVFHDLGVDRIVSGGQTMNPSTEDILAAIQSIPAKNIIVLANNKNIIMASEQACKLADRNAVVLPTRTIPQGISAMLAFSPDLGVEENVINMKAASDNVSTGQITFAARDSEFDGKSIKEGEIIGIADGKLIVNEHSLEKAALKLTKKLVKKTTSFVTVIYGSDVTEEQQAAVSELLTASLPGDVELTFVYGGQPVYYFYISAE